MAKRRVARANLDMLHAAIDDMSAVESDHIRAYVLGYVCAYVPQDVWAQALASAVKTIEENR